MNKKRRKIIYNDRVCKNCGRDYYAHAWVECPYCHMAHCLLLCEICMDSEEAIKKALKKDHEDIEKSKKGYLED